MDWFQRIFILEPSNLALGRHMTFYPLDKKSHLHEAYARPFSVGGHDLLLVHSNGASHIVRNYCPHSGCNLHEATVRDGKLYCAHDGSFYYLESGESGHCTKSGLIAPVVASLIKYEVEFSGELIGVNL